MKTDLEKRTGECKKCGTTWVVSHLPVPKTCPECISLEADAKLWGYLVMVLDKLGDNNVTARQIYNYVVTQQVRRDAMIVLGRIGGKASAAKLTPAERKKRATKASHARKPLKP